MNLIRKRSEQRAKEEKNRRENRRVRYARQKASRPMTGHIDGHDQVNDSNNISEQSDVVARASCTGQEDTMVSGFHFHEFDFFKVTLEVLRSLTSDQRIRKFIGNMLMDTFISSRPKNFVSIVTWPHMMEGIMKQLDTDLSREQVFLNSYPWPSQQDGNCWALYEAIDGKVGPLWARMTCAFLNQAPTADFFEYIWKDAQRKYGQDTIVCEKKDNTSPLKLHVTARSDCLSIVYVKEFRILQGVALIGVQEDIDQKDDLSVLVNYRITFYPTYSAHLFWQYR